jgi:hypothetical protein
LSEIAGYVDDADLIAALLDGEQLSGDQRIENADLLLGFKSILETRLADQLKTQLGDLLGDRILPQVVSWARNQGLAGLTPLTRGFSDEQLTRWVADAYEHYHDKPSTTELEELERLTSHNERSFLRLVYLRWSRQWPVLRTTLRALEISASNRFKRWALATVPVQVQSVVRPGQGFFLGLGLHEGNEQAEETYALLSGLVDNSTESPLTCDSTHSDAPPSATSPNPEQMMHSDSIVRLLSLLELLVGNSEELK